VGPREVVGVVKVVSNLLAKMTLTPKGLRETDCVLHTAKNNKEKKKEKKKKEEEKNGPPMIPYGEALKTKRFLYASENAVPLLSLFTLSYISSFTAPLSPRASCPTVRRPPLFLLSLLPPFLSITSLSLSDFLLLSRSKRLTILAFDFSFIALVE
jgi:hypothetical protein